MKRRHSHKVLGSKAEKPNLTSSFWFRNLNQIAAPDLIRMTDGCLVSCIMHENPPSRRPHLGKRWFEKPLRHAVSQQSSDNPFLPSYSLWDSSYWPAVSYELKADQTLATYQDICYSTCPYGLWRHSKSQLGGPWLYLYILKLHPGCGNPFLLDTRAWKARPRRLHILIKFVSSHACVCMPSVENPVALGLTSGSHRHRASFDFLPSPHSNLLSPRSTNNILQILPHMGWEWGTRCFDVGLGSGLWSRSNLYL